VRSLKSQLFAVLSAVVLLPCLALLVILGANRTTTVPSEPLLRYVRLNRLVASFVKVSEDGTLSVDVDKSVPPWLMLVVIDRGARVVYSNLEEFVIGQTLDPAAIIGGLSNGDPYRRIILETLVADHRAVGSYVAVLSIGDRDYSDQPMWLMTVMIVFLISISLVGLITSLVVGKAGASVLSLKTAAGRIASGDLETPVPCTGPQELRSLASALDRMRHSIKEEEDKRVRFIAAVSHDLKTPLTSIIGYLEVLEDGLASDPKETERILSVMRGKASVLDGRIAELLDFARMSTGAWSSRLERVAILPFLDEQGKSFAEDAELLGFQWSFTASVSPDRESAGVSMDRALVTRALENIVSNDFRYCPPGSQVSMDIRVQGTGVEGCCEISISDQGPGIKAEDQDRIFDPYFRGSASRREEGSGLGLYIARSIARSHGGDLALLKKDGQAGATFVFTLPLLEDDAQ